VTPRATNSLAIACVIAPMERLLEDVSFHAARRTGETITIDAGFVDTRLAGIAGDDNLAQYIL